jgi:hypothetical protein
VGLFTVNNIAVILLQLIITLALLDDWGVLAAAVARTAALLAGQLGMCWIVRFHLGSVAMRPPREYLVSVAILTATGAVSLLWSPSTLLEFTVASAVLLGAFVFAAGFRAREFGELVRIIRGR